MTTAVHLALILAATAVVLVSLAALYRAGRDESKRWLTGMPTDYAAEVRAFFAKHRKPKAEPVPVKRGRHLREPGTGPWLSNDGMHGIGHVTDRTAS